MTKEAPSLVDKLYNICMESLDKESVATKAKEILIAGWNLFAQDAYRQIEIIVKLLSPKTVNPDESAKMLRQHFCHFASFFDREVLNLRAVKNHIFVVKNL